MSEFELKIESQPLFVVNILPVADLSTNSPFSLTVNTVFEPHFTLVMSKVVDSGGQNTATQSSEIFTTTAVGNLSALKLVALTSGGVELVDFASVGSLARMSGITISAASSGASVTVKRFGRLSDPSWSWLEGQTLFCGTSGALTTNAPTSIASRQVGVALDATSILVNLSDLIILE